MSNQLKKMNELRNMESYGVFIDDTGSPGIGTPWLHKNRKTYVGIIVSPEQMPEILEEMPKAIEALHRLTSEVEFHFSELINQRPNINQDIKTKVVESMVKIFDKYKFPIFVQTFDPKLWKVQKARADKINPLPQKALGYFNSSKYDEMALLFLLIRIKKYIESKNGRAEVFVDGGLIRQAGSSITIEQWESFCNGGQIHFCDSREIFPIQLADYAAFNLNRQQLLVGRQDVDGFNDFNMGLLEMMSSISMNYQNIDQLAVSVELTEKKRWKSNLHGPELEKVKRMFFNKETGNK